MQHGTGFMGRGPLSSAFSSDGGKTWRNVGNPADDGSDGDHAFIDLTADDRGNFHAVWLDKRSGTDKGLYSAFFESNSQKWNKNSTLDSKVCDCCWNVVKSSRTGRLHALYRDKVPRDMGLAISHDYGKSWRKAGPVRDFQWMFEACVHVGGGLAIEEKEGKTIYTLWFGPEMNSILVCTICHKKTKRAVGTNHSDSEVWNALFQTLEYPIVVNSPLRGLKELRIETH